MKKPIIFYEERLLIETDSVNGVVLRLRIAILHFRRDLGKSWLGRIFDKGAKGLISKAINYDNKYFRKIN